MNENTLPQTNDNLDLLSLGKIALNQEIDGLQALKDNLGDTFLHALEVLSSIEGHVITTGMGKSGIVARKIASTMASTGTPSVFIHPAEASHGDLGLITKQDAILALSDSGNTKELCDIIEYSRRINIPLISITRQSKTLLSEAADIKLVIPNTPEACPNGLAPTTSTTMMMALGDALAICLLKQRNFTSDDFRQFHPGGSLGRSLLRVKDFMHTGDQLPIVSLSTDINTLLSEMSGKKLGCAGVIDHAGSLIGVVTDGDLRRHMLSVNLRNATAADLMTHNPKTIQSKSLLAEAVSKMNELSITNLFVIEDDKPIGLLHIHDCLRAGFR